MIPFMDLDAQYKSIQNEIDEAIFKVIKSYKFINGPEVEIFEKRFAEIQQVSYCVPCSSGTSALHIAYEILEISNGDEVIVPAVTFIATTEPLRQVGAKPVFVDIDPVSYNIDVTKLEKAINLKTKAIVLVHLHGNPCEMDEIMDIAKKHNLYVIEDCAQAHLAEYKDIKLGNFGDIAAFSFYPGKNLGAYGDAGAIVTNNVDLYQKAKLLVNHGRKEKYVHDVEGYNFRMDTIQAAILNVKLNYLKEWTELRIEIAKNYNQFFINNSEIEIPEVNLNKKHVYHIYSILSKRRDKIIAELLKKHISYGIHYPIPLHLQPAYNHLGYKKGDLKIAEKLCDEFLSIPLYAELTDKQVCLIQEIVNKAAINENS